eukprot:CAMPEP_0119131068 /NCGR_PEP_ID=MMETSP1310-20130426/9367_1 /TAXON_ID=464262 /ORGANISM="Genus nov. species nov., Strain RCC2339" /LENGTH=554 /DNA_ID=CAMNT_0007121621 /DNA_START=78 /DNA_END=1740 /DNA_ORIENTATION=+
MQGMQGMPGMGGSPVIVINSTPQQESVRETQIQNIETAKTVADVIRTSLGPRAMLKMIFSAHGLVITNDGNAILRELEVVHPAAKMIVDLSRAQDEEVGDGTTTVIILAGEILHLAEPLLKRGIHPIFVVAGYSRALDDIMEHLYKISFEVDLDDRENMMKLLRNTLGTKMVRSHIDLFCGMALDAVRTVTRVVEGKKDIDIKRFVKIEKVPGADISDSCVIPGVVINKDVTHTGMKRRIENPRIICLDCSLEYKKGESATEVQLERAGDFEKLLEIEEQYIKRMCTEILKHKPDIVITEKGCSDLAQHFFFRAGVVALRRFRKTDNDRIARASGATIVNQVDELQESFVGTKCGLFEVRKLGDEYFSFLTDCKDPQACTLLLRGPSKDHLNEVERNLHDVMAVAKNIFLEPRLVLGGGATEMSTAQMLREKAAAIAGREQFAYQAIADALEVIPRTLAANCGVKPIRQITQLRAKHAEDPETNRAWGIDGTTGKVAKMDELNIWEPLVVKSQSLKTAIEASMMLLRVDKIVSGSKKSKGNNGPQMSGPPPMYY